MNALIRRGWWRRLPSVLLLLAAAPVAGQAPDPDRIEAVADSAARAALESGPLAGLALGVAVDGEPVLIRGYGAADLEHDVPVRAGTVFRIGSITKQFTAAAVMQLVESGALALDDPLTKYLPDYPEPGERVTIEHLLTHTSGIKSYTDLGDAFWDRSAQPLRHEQMIALFRDEPFEFEPGAEYRYSNSGYYLLGVIVEKVSGMPYDAYVREHLTEPLGLEGTRYCHEEEIIEGRAEGYAVAGDGGLRNDDAIHMNTPGAAGALCSTVPDLLTWTHALSNGRVVSPASYRRMTTPAVLSTGDTTSYGYGLVMGALEGHRRIAHGGGIPGFVSTVSHYPDSNLSIAVLINTEGGLPGEIEEAIARAALGLPPMEPLADVALSEEERARYTGVYRFAALDLELEIFEVDGRLQLQTAGGSAVPFPLMHQGDGEFVVNGQRAVRLVFHGPMPADSVVLHQGSERFQGSRVR